MKKWLFASLVAFGTSVAAQRAEPVVLPNPILFVGQVPIPGDFTTVASTFGNHDGHQSSAPRGGDLSSSIRVAR